MRVLHGVAAAADAERIEAALAPYRALAASVAPEARLGLRRAGPFALVVTRAGGDAAARFAAALETMEGAERLALAHSALLNGLAAKVDILPARLGAAAPDDRTLRAQTRARAPALSAALARIAGCAEYALRLTERDPAPRAPAAPADVGGRAYLRRRLAARQAKEALGAAREAFLDGAAAAAGSIGRELRVVRGPTERRPRLALDIAVLAPRTAERDVERLAEAVAPRAEALGLDFAAIGPWAPFSFVEPSDAPEAGQDPAQDPTQESADGAARESGRARAS